MTLYDCMSVVQLGLDFRCFHHVQSRPAYDRIVPCQTLLLTSRSADVHQLVNQRAKWGRDANERGLRHDGDKNG